jgi:hypothetical protein
VAWRTLWVAFRGLLVPIYELTRDAIVPVDQVKLASQGIRERDDLQRLLRTNIAAVLAGESNVWAVMFQERVKQEKFFNAISAGLDLKSLALAYHVKCDKDRAIEDYDQAP